MVNRVENEDQHDRTPLLESRIIRAPVRFRVSSPNQENGFVGPVVRFVAGPARNSFTAVREAAALSIFRDSELAHNVRWLSVRRCGSMEGFSHDRVYEAAHNNRCHSPSGGIGNIDRTGVCGRTVIARQPLRSAKGQNLAQFGQHFSVLVSRTFRPPRTVDCGCTSNRTRMTGHEKARQNERAGNSEFGLGLCRRV